MTNPDVRGFVVVEETIMVRLNFTVTRKGFHSVSCALRAVIPWTMTRTFNGVSVLLLL